MQPGCPALVHGGARCPAHTRVNDQRRGTAHQRGYDGRWRAYRITYLAAHPLCVLCAGEGQVEPATVVDHIDAPKGDAAKFWDQGNHRALCKRHHDLRTDEGDFGR